MYLEARREYNGITNIKDAGVWTKDTNKSLVRTSI